MQGEVLHYDEAQGFGFITGADGNRYTFAREDLRRGTVIASGAVVEFLPASGQARDIFSIRAQAAAPATAAPTASAAPPKTPPLQPHRSISAAWLKTARPTIADCRVISGEA